MLTKIDKSFFRITVYIFTSLKGAYRDDKAHLKSYVCREKIWIVLDQIIVETAK